MLDAKHIDELVKKAADFGGGKIHIIVNNAGFTWDGVIHKVWLSSTVSQLWEDKRLLSSIGPACPRDNKY